MSASGRQIPPGVPDDFAARLRLALAQRGLSLQRLRAHLEARGVDISVATLSYWVNGRSRPTRGKSMTILRHLERILEVPPGTLLAGTGDEGEPPAGAALGRAAVIEQAIREHGIVLDERRVPVMVHQIVHVGADRSSQVLEQRILARATARGAERWAIALRGPLADIQVRETIGCRVLRTIDLPPDLCIIEFILARPMEKDEMVLTATSIAIPGDGEPVAGNSFAVSHGVERVVLEGRFAGEAPARVTRTFHPIGDEADPAGPGAEDGDAGDQDEGIYRHDAMVQATLEAPEAGLHSLDWQW